MVARKRTADRIRAMTGRLPSEARVPGFVERVHKALETREEAAIGMLLQMPVRNVDETSPRVNG